MPLDELAKFATTISNYAYIVLVILAIYYLGKAIFGFGTGAKMGTRLTSWDKSPFVKFGKWASKETRKDSRGEKVKLMNEYVREEKELKLIEEISGAIEDAQDEIKDIRTKGQFAKKKDAKNLISAVDGVGGAIQAALKKFPRLNKSTWRQYKKTQVILDDLRKNKAPASELKKIEAEVKLILEKHNETRQRLMQVDKTYGGQVEPVLEEIKKIRNFPTALTVAPPGTEGPPPTLQIRLANLNNLLTMWKDQAIPEVEDLEKEAIKLVEALIVRFRDLWEE